MEVSFKCSSALDNNILSWLGICGGETRGLVPTIGSWCVFRPIYHPVTYVLPDKEPPARELRTAGRREALRRTQGLEIGTLFL